MKKLILKKDAVEALRDFVNQEARLQFLAENLSFPFNKELDLMTQNFVAATVQYMQIRLTQLQKTHPYRSPWQVVALVPRPLAWLRGRVLPGMDCSATAVAAGLLCEARRIKLTDIHFPLSIFHLSICTVINKEMFK